MAFDQIMGYISIRVEKHCRKRRQRFFQAFSPLPTMFSKAFFLNSFTLHANLMTSKIWTNGDTIIRLSKNIVEKGEIARYEQFLLPQCFQKLPVVDVSK